MTKFPWARAMQIGMGVLHLAPRDFWAMTLPELNAAAVGAGLAQAPGTMTRQTLEALRAEFPDRQNPD